MICNEKCNIILNVFTLWNIFFQAAVYFCNTLRAINDIGFFLSCLVFDRKTHKKKKKIHVLQRTATRYYNVQNVGNKSQFTSVFSSPLSTNHTCHSLQKIKNPFEFSFDICCATVCVQIYFGSRVVTHAEIGSNTPRDLYEDKEVQKMDGKLENKSYF